MSYTDSKPDPRLRHPMVIEASLAITLLLVASIFIASKEFAVVQKQTRSEGVVIKVEDIPITHQIRRPLPPAKPTIPIETDDPEIEGALTIPEPRDWSEIAPPPPAMDEDIFDFFAIEQKPELIGGAQAIYDYIQEHNLFPKMALKAGVGGTCTIQFTVDETGKPTYISVLQENPRGLGFGEVGIKAISAMKFKPGKQRDRFVKVRMKQEISFKVK